MATCAICSSTFQWVKGNLSLERNGVNILLKGVTYCSCKCPDEIHITEEVQSLIDKTISTRKAASLNKNSIQLTINIAN